MDWQLAIPLTVVLMISGCTSPNPAGANDPADPETILKGPIVTATAFYWANECCHVVEIHVDNTRSDKDFERCSLQTTGLEGSNECYSVVSSEGERFAGELDGGTSRVVAGFSTDFRLKYSTQADTVLLRIECKDGACPRDAAEARMTLPALGTEPPLSLGIGVPTRPSCYGTSMCPVLLDISHASPDVTWDGIDVRVNDAQAEYGDTGFPTYCRGTTSAGRGYWHCTSQSPPSGAPLRGTEYIVLSLHDDQDPWGGTAKILHKQTGKILWIGRVPTS